MSDIDSRADMIIAAARAEAEAVADAAALDRWRGAFLGKNGPVEEMLAEIPKAAPADKPRVGKAANRLKQTLKEIETSLRAKLDERAARAEEGVAFDPTLPGVRPPRGSRHPIRETISAIVESLGRLGFVVARGPEIERPHYNFDALNIPPDHPARDLTDNFYIRDDLVLRSQTSTVQIRVMEKMRPPIRIIAPGKVYRPDTVDASHCFQFFQVEGLMVEEGVSFRDLRTILVLFARDMFGDDVEVRLRPHYFPFTEPSAELDVSCFLCKMAGCPTCKGRGWIEVGGCGMVHPNVFQAVGLDPEQYVGFAFGMGIDRIAMLRHGIHDIRLFTENDLRFLEQFL